MVGWVGGQLRVGNAWIGYLVPSNVLVPWNGEHPRSSFDNAASLITTTLEVSNDH